jgi:hypothetical protein
MTKNFLLEKCTEPESFSFLFIERQAAKNIDNLQTLTQESLHLFKYEALGYDSSDSARSPRFTSR